MSKAVVSSESSSCCSNHFFSEDVGFAVDSSDDMDINKGQMYGTMKLVINVPKDIGTNVAIY